MNWEHQYSKKCLELKLERPYRPKEFEGVLLELPERGSSRSVLILARVLRSVRRAFGKWAHVYRSL